MMIDRADNIRRMEEGKPLLAVCNGAGHSDGIFEETPAKL